MCWWMRLSYKVSCWQLWRPAGPIHLQLQVRYVEISPSDVPVAWALWKSQRPAPGTGNSAALQNESAPFERSALTATVTQISHYLDCVNQTSTALISTHNFRCGLRQASKWLYLSSIGGADCDICCFIEEYEVIWHEAKACRFFVITPTLCNDNWICWFPMPLWCRPCGIFGNMGRHFRGRGKSKFLLFT